VEVGRGVAWMGRERIIHYTVNPASEQKQRRDGRVSGVGRVVFNEPSVLTSLDHDYSNRGGEDRLFHPVMGSLGNGFRARCR
jgi:hypothetical protein